MASMLQRVLPDLRMMVEGMGLEESVSERLSEVGKKEATSPIREAFGGRRLLGRSKSPSRALW
jgi:hypothetical protein